MFFYRVDMCGGLVYFVLIEKEMLKSDAEYIYINVNVCVWYRVNIYSCTL